MYANQLAANQQGFNQADRSFANNMGLNSQGFNQATQAFSLGNSALQNQNSMNLANNTFDNQTMQNQFAQQQQQANYQNTLRQQQIAEAQMRQLQPLNNINALLTGQQVGMPQMPQFNAAGAAQPVNYMGAAQNQYQSSLDAFNAQNMNANSFTNGLFNLGGSLGSAAMFNFSDSRLKRIIKKVGQVKGVALYRFKYHGSDVEHVGVIAQHLQKVRPDLVKRHQNGYLMVNYRGLMEA
jgi:hypothetical protein